MKVDILAIGAHPDDVELGCGGTLIKQIQLGHTVGILDLTRGESGTRGTPEVRASEAQQAASIIGAVQRENLGLPDGFLEASADQKIALIRMIRDFQPDIVFGNAMEDRHPDHGNGAKLIEEACFLSGLAKISTEVNGISQAHWRPRLVLHYIQDRYLKPDVVMDISDVMDKKMESILAHKSQFFDPNSPEPETYIASKGFLDNIPARAMEHGRPCGFKFGEAFTCSKYLGVKNIAELW
jgi:bacillithiol biosynthesis deacetylase BshB1